MVEPLALQLHRRFLAGESIQDLSRDLGIPADRLAQRVQAAAKYLQRQSETAIAAGIGEPRPAVPDAA